MKTGWVALLAALLMIPLPAGPEPLTVKAVVAVRRSVVPILCGFIDSEGQFKTVGTAGSGFFIDKLGHILTADHVVREWAKISTDSRPCFPAIYIPFGGWEVGRTRQAGGVKWFRVKSCRTKQQLDVAVCETTENPFSDPAIKKEIQAAKLGSALRYEDGTAVAFTGFPLHFIRPVSAIGSIASYVPGESLLVIDKTAWPGASGSPVYVGDSRVIGMVVQRGIGEAAGLAFARTADVIRAFLREEKIQIE